MLVHVCDMTYDAIQVKIIYWWWWWWWWWRWWWLYIDACKCLFRPKLDLGATQFLAALCNNRHSNVSSELFFLSELFIFPWPLVMSELELSKHGKKEVYTVQTMELWFSQPFTPGLPFNWIVYKSLPFLLQVLFLLRALYFGWEWVSRPCRPARGCESLCRPSRPAGCLQHGARHNLHFSLLDFYRCGSVSHPLNLSWSVSNGLKLVYIHTR